MDRVKLGRTGLEVSVLGVGAGGPSQIGKKTGKTPAESAALLRTAFDAGVNFVDTSENDGTEPLVGLALRDVPRDVPAFLAQAVGTLVEGWVDAGEVDDREDPLGFAVHGGGAVSVPDAAYRFCRCEPGVHVVLSGTGNPDHLRQSLASFGRGPLPAADVARLRRVFQRVDSITGQGEWRGRRAP